MNKFWITANCFREDREWFLQENDEFSVNLDDLICVTCNKLLDVVLYSYMPSIKARFIFVKKKLTFLFLKPIY
jgi:hypothetical protein